ncbi:uncharacterized protein LOC113388447 [Ctenocephalides felis]|uniref:uncharacterized protein LOC113388447 n=1 Tax=Ctenocephalides felis TaxID=7515 RepID=UPI000E6E4642|nr:uncharacterized protein LOC113388447 [Ctenocephalides felis]
MGKLLDIWISGDLMCRLGTSQIKKISDKLRGMRNNIPVEFCRRPRSLRFLNSWKATEYRQFLLYTGPIVLKSIISKDFYNNFLTLHVAIRILSSRDFSDESLLNYSKSLLTYFVNGFKLLYGEHLVSHNVHSLIHLTDDVRRFGSLESFSAFKFENYMQTLKKYIRKPERPLQQIARRYHEFQEYHTQKVYEDNCDNFDNDIEFSPCLSTVHFDGPLFTSCGNPQFEKLKCGSAIINIRREADRYCSLIDGSIIYICNIASLNGEAVIIGQRFKMMDDVYTIPCRSSFIGIYRVYDLASVQVWPVKNIKSKIFIISDTSSDTKIALPLLHLC